MASAIGSGTKAEASAPLSEWRVSVEDIVDLAARVVEMREVARYFDGVVKDSEEEAPAWLSELGDEARDMLSVLGRIVETKPRPNKHKKFDLRNCVSSWDDDEDGVRPSFRAMYESSTVIKPGFGKRVKVKFDDGVEYQGVICNHGKKEQDLEHRDGRWHILFDDETEGRFDDDDVDVVVTNERLLKRMEWPIQKFYMKHHNGKKLLRLIHNPTDDVNMRKRLRTLQAARPFAGSTSTKRTATFGEGGGATVNVKNYAPRHSSEGGGDSEVPAKSRNAGTEQRHSNSPTRERSPTPMRSHRR